MQKAGDHKTHHQQEVVNVPIADTSTSSAHEEITGTTFCSSQQEIRHDHEEVVVRNYSEMVKLLSEVELPSPSPAPTSPCTLTREENVISSRFHHEAGQTSGCTKRKANIDHIDQEVNVERERPRELESKQHDYQQPPDHPQRVATHHINTTTDKRRRHRISDRIRVLQALVPNCSNKRDKALILGDATDYIKFLQMQLQVMMQYYCMGIGIMSQGPYIMFPPVGQPNLLAPTQHGIPQYGFYLPTNFPLYLSGTGFPQLMPPSPMEAAGTGTHYPRPLLYHQQQQFPPQTTLFHSTTPSSNSGTIIIPTTR